jgi:hypothetical protein
MRVIAHVSGLCSKSSDGTCSITDLVGPLQDAPEEVTKFLRDNSRLFKVEGNIVSRTDDPLWKEFDTRWSNTHDPEGMSAEGSKVYWIIFEAKERWKKLGTGPVENGEWVI